MLYCYISYKQKIMEDIMPISSIMCKFGYDDYLIFYGGKEKIHIESDKVIHLDCDDTYEGLPNKTHSLCKYFLTSELSHKYTHICKTDRSTIIKQLIPYLPQLDYYGYTQSGSDPPDYRRTYHYGKCSQNSEWNNKKYTGEFVTYCGGGVCYVLSQKSIKIIAGTPDDPTSEIYEDLYVGKTLFKNKIYPYHLDTLKYIEKW